MTANKKSIRIVFIAIFFAIATLADIKFKGKFYQRLPTSIQSYLDKL